MQINPNVAGGDVPLSSLAPGDCLDGPDGAPAMLTQGVNDGSQNLFIVSLGNGSLTPLEPAHAVKPRPDLQVSRVESQPTPPAGAGGPVDQRAGIAAAHRVTAANPKR